MITFLKDQMTMIITYSIYTANFLDAKIATISCVTRPDALWMPSLQIKAAVTFWSRFCNFLLQQIFKVKIATFSCICLVNSKKIFAPKSCRIATFRCKWFFQNFPNLQLHISCNLSNNKIFILYRVILGSEILLC